MLNQPTSSPMMKRMLGLFWSAASSVAGCVPPRSPRPIANPPEAVVAALKIRSMAFSGYLS